MHPLAISATLEEVLNLVGTFVFAMSGALLAVRKRYDFVGMIVLAEITAIGGGVLRDLVLGAVPPPPSPITSRSCCRSPPRG